MVTLFKKEVYPIKEILTRIGKEHVIFNNEFVYMGNPEYKAFADQGTNCSTCANKGSYFIKEAWIVENNHVFGFGLYGQNHEGEEIKFFSQDDQVICQMCKEKTNDNIR